MLNRKMIVLLFSVCLLLPSQKIKADTFTNRLAGNDRYETASMIIQNGWQDDSTYAIITSGTNYPDALSAAPLAKQYNAPIIITDKDKLNENAAIELKRLGVKNVFIIGGIGAVSKAVEDSLASMNIICTRISGKDRYETSAEVAKQLKPSREVFIVTGDSYSDALSVAPIAAKRGDPILLTSKDELSQSVEQYIYKEKVDKVYVLGGNDIISEKCIANIPNSIRIYGEDAYERNINVVNEFLKDIDLDTVYIASGENFPDALAGTAAAPNTASPIILMDTGHTKAAGDFLKSKIDSIKFINILGGEGAVPLSCLQDVLGSAANYSRREKFYNMEETASNMDLVQGDWVYYSSNNKQDADGLYRIKIDGSSKQCLDSGSINGIYVNDDWVYYNNGYKLYKIKIDGTDRQLVIDDYVSFIEIRGEWIYYCDSKGIFKMKKDGSNLQNIALGYIDSVQSDGNYFYYNAIPDGKIHRVDINGNNGGVVYNNPSSLIKVDNNYIYFKDKNLSALYRINKDGSDKTKIDNENIRNIQKEEYQGFEITSMYPRDGQNNVYLKFGYIDIVFSENTVKCYDLERINLTDASGKQIKISSAVPGIDYKQSFLVIPEEQLQKNTKYTLSILKGTIQAEDGELYNKYIYITFQTGN